ncbi:MipA/OmpV family protein [Thalassotalea aquiviva]|uniref:MipA/OmpV family protein n=1 Tax=Thalassotalea aquiviva TaxID=3242415 RepID=UPI00352AB96D
MLKILPKTLLLLLLLGPNLANANWYYGLLTLKPANKYIGDDASPVLFPVIGYRSDTLLFTGKDLHYTVYSNDTVSLTTGLSARFDGFDENDSPFFEGLDKRKNSLDFDAQIQLKQNQWIYSAGLKQDLLSVHGGYELSSHIGYQINHFAPFFITAKVGAKYLSQDLSQYYYGVGENESSVFAPYNTDDGFGTQAKVLFFTPIFFNAMTRLELSVNQYSRSLSESPLIDGDTSLSAMFMFLKPF